MEASGYASAMAELLNERVHLVGFPDGHPNPRVRFRDGVMEIRTAADEWKVIRCAFRYVTQRPWNRIPVSTKTLILNPIIYALPFWLLVMGFRWTFIALRLRKRSRLGLCNTCGYDIVGQDACPECGTAIHEMPSESRRKNEGHSASP